MTAHHTLAKALAARICQRRPRLRHVPTPSLAAQRCASMEVGNTHKRTHPYGWGVPEEGLGGRRPLGAILIACLLALTILAGCNTASSASECQSFTIPNAAMSPTYNAGELVTIDTQAYASARPRRGQIVIVKEPSTNGQEEALRVIGLPGETVRLSATQTYINGVLLTEPFVLHRGTQQPMTVTLASNQYFLMGDNRPQSTDSRAFGPVPLSAIVAQIGTQYCPND